MRIFFLAPSISLRTPRARVYIYPVLIQKLESNSAASRIAVLQCLRTLFSEGDFVHEEPQLTLRTIITSDWDQKVRQAAEQALDMLDSKLRKSRASTIGCARTAFHDHE